LPLNKLDNFIKNTEGRILYVNPSDLDSTDSITNEGNSLAQPFKTIQRALLEAARFSYLKGNNNDLTEKTTILLFPGEHVIDNRPGYAIYNNNGVAYATPKDGGVGSVAQTLLSLELDSNFDLTQQDNILYKFNSVYGGVIVPRGTSIVGLDLRKTKLRPKYVPNPTDPNVPNSSIFKITGACYFWQFSLFDGDDSGLVYTNPRDFSSQYSSQPRFSHHKLTCFEYCDGVNVVNRLSFGELTDLDMYYSKVSNAYNSYREIENDSKFPQSSTSFAKRAPEWEIVGAFKSDPINIENIFSGNGTTASNRITVVTDVPHELNFGTPIKIRGVSSSEYNVSTFVQDILSETEFTYLLPTFPPNLNATPQLNDATVTIETDTVGGASPYVFNISLRSVWGMNGMHADGAKASGFRSMVVAQFTAVSLQKDDRAFVKYNKTTRTYDSVEYVPVYGSALPLGASQTNTEKVYHLDQDAIYRPDWESSHIKISNDSFIQIVSVFAIGFSYHFDVNSGADASITNSNSNFGQVALKSDGYKVEAFDKDDHGYITSIVSPRDVDLTSSDEIEWLSLDVVKTRTVANPQKLYLYGFNAESATPISLTQGYRIGAKLNDELYIRFLGIDYAADIYMTGKNNQTSRNQKSYVVTAIKNNIFTIGPHNLKTGEKIIIQSKKGDLPESLTEHIVYYAITDDLPGSKLNSQQIQVAASFNYAFLNEPIQTYGGDPNSDIIINSRVSDKDAGDIGSPIQWDSDNSQWYINVGGSNNEIYNAFLDSGVGYDPTNELKFSESSDLAFVTRVADERGLDEKVYKLRVVIPKESVNAKNPEIGFILQDSSFTGAIDDNDIFGSNKTVLSLDETRYRRNQKFIAKCTVSDSTVTVTTELPHKLNEGDFVIIRNVKDNNETNTGVFNRGYNGSFVVANVINDMQFTYSTIDIAGIFHDPGTFLNDTNIRTIDELPRLEKNDIRSNLYIYRTDVISEYIKDERDGIYHLYVLNASNFPTSTFTNYKFTQTPVDLYPQLDRDNVDSNPKSAKTFAKRAPIGDVVTNDLKKSITRESLDIFCKKFGKGLEIFSVSATQQPTATINFNLNHGLAGVVNGTLVENSSSGRINGTYYNVKLYNENTLTNWNGATAKVVVSGNKVTSAEIMSKGSGYANGNKLYFDINVIGGSANAYLELATSGITTYVGDVVQITGDGNTEDGYYRITQVNDKDTITVARHSADPSISPGQYAFVVGQSIRIQSNSFSEKRVTIDGETTVIVGLVTFTTYTPHGLNVGNKFRLINSSNLSYGDYVVKDVNSVTQFDVKVNVGSAITNTSLQNGYALKHGLSSNQGISDIRTESYSSRTIPFYGGETFKLTSEINAGDAGVLNIQCLTGISTSKRLKLGDFVQVNDEIMRINSSPSDTSIQVDRGYLGTRQGNHPINSIIKKIEVIPVEFRRPSILRASGHTFEYLGYGPGNYSTALPQVQIKTLSDREDFLVQAQERSAGAVIYTGMNSKGDTFNGNTKVSASSGQTISYDIPKPTITGQDPSKLSVNFDEVTVRERILVEGGTSGYVLSQFDGPVTMTRSLRVKGKTTLNGQLRVTFREKAVNENSGSIVSKGGIGVGDDSYFRTKVDILGELKTYTGIVPDEDFGAYIGRPGIAYSEAYIGDIRIGAASSTTISTRTGGLTLTATGGNLTQTASGAVSVTASGGNLTQTASGAVSVTANGGNLTQTASSAINQTATAGKFTITASANDVEVNAGTGKSISLKKSTYITGDLDVRGAESVPPGLNSGTIRANYLEIPNITPVGGIVIWSGNQDQLPAVTVNGSVVTMWSVCDGRAISRTTYSALFNIIGTKFGNGNGTTTFNLPDLRNIFLIGSNSDNGSNIEDPGTTKRTGGSKDSIVVTHDHGLSGTGTHPHGVTIDMTPNALSMSGNTTNASGLHDHTISSNTTNGGSYKSDIISTSRTGAFPISDAIDGMVRGSEFADTNASSISRGNKSIPTGGGHSHPVSVSGAQHDHTGSVNGDGGHGHTVDSRGNSGENKNLPPYFSLYYIMRIL
jgi:microcystin-dependent protein